MVGLGAWIAAACLLYAPVVVKLAHDWTADPNYSHGILIPPIALFLVWRQRHALRAAPIEPSDTGLIVLALSLLLFVAGSLGAELFLTRISLVGVIGGTVLYALGGRHLSLVRFPLLFLVFMIPLPAIIFDRVAVSLQLMASVFGERLLQLADIPVLRDGNILRLANITLEVDEACSGIRSLAALVSVAALIGYLYESVRWRRIAIAVAAVPLAIILNGIRIAGTAMAAARFGRVAATGAIHETAGWAVFVVAIFCVMALHRLSAMKRPAAAAWEVA